METISVRSFSEGRTFVGTRKASISSFVKRTTAAVREKSKVKKKCRYSEKHYFAEYLFSSCHAQPYSSDCRPPNHS